MNRGFTLVELVAVIAIVAIVSAIAVPGFRSLMESQRTKDAAYEFLNGITLARSEAVKRNARVTITPAGGNWANGWTVTSASGQALLNQSPIDAITITAAPATLVFAANGRLPTGSASASFQIDTGATTTTHVRCVQVDLSGMPRSRRGTCA